MYLAILVSAISSVSIKGKISWKNLKKKIIVDRHRLCYVFFPLIYLSWFTVTWFLISNESFVFRFLIWFFFAESKEGLCAPPNRLFITGAMQKCSTDTDCPYDAKCCASKSGVKVCAPAQPAFTGKISLPSKLARKRWIPWSLDWLIDWLFDRSIDWFIEFDWLFDWSIDWFIDWLMDWLIDWLCSIDFFLSPCSLSTSAHGGGRSRPQHRVLHKLYSRLCGDQRQLRAHSVQRE